MKGDVLSVSEEVFKEYYSDCMHECIASQNKEIRDDALKKAVEYNRCQMYVLNDNFGQCVLMQTDPGGYESRLLKNFSSFETKEIGENCLFIARFVSDKADGHCYSIVVGDDSGYEVAATALDSVTKDRLIEEYTDFFHNPPQFLSEKPKMLIGKVRSSEDLDRLNLCR